MKALSIRQPWATCLATGIKPIENRSRATKYRGTFIIHASKTFDHEGLKWLKERNYVDSKATSEMFPQGCIIGLADIINCVQSFNSEWFFGPHGYVIKNARMTKQIPFTGKLGFFEVPEQIIKMIL